MKVRISIVLLAIILFGSISVAADASKDEIKIRMKERYPILTDLKEKGKIGETHLGFVELVDLKSEKDVAIQNIVNDENKDREMLYKIIAEQAGANPKLVGRQNAFRIFQKAGDDEFFKGADGIWHRKKDMKVETKEEDKGEKDKEAE